MIVMDRRERQELIDRLQAENVETLVDMERRARREDPEPWTLPTPTPTKSLADFESVVNDRIGMLVDIIGEETGAVQRKYDRKAAAEFKRVSISLVAVWAEIAALRNMIVSIRNELRNSLEENQLRKNANVTMLDKRGGRNVA